MRRLARIPNLPFKGAAFFAKFFGMGRKMAFAGFDKLEYPGDEQMAWLLANTNFRFVGFYLAPAPSRPTSGWMTRRAVLAAQGWGFAPVYVGQQEPSQPGQHNLTPTQGATDGGNAAQLMSTAGFKNGSVVYLDIEQGGPASANTLHYVTAWVDAVRTDGRYSPGLYCSHTTAASLLAARPGLPVWTWNLKGAVPGPNYPPNLPTNDPAGSGVPTAIVWQYAQNVSITLQSNPPVDFGLDLDCASMADPSTASIAALI